MIDNFELIKRSRLININVHLLNVNSLFKINKIVALNKKLHLFFLDFDSKICTKNEF